MPEFARENPHSFWEAADAFERKNGRAYTDLQIALPRELAPEQRHELARETTRELMDERFAYTLAVHICVERPLRLPAASSPCAHTCCSGHPRSAPAEADRQEACAALKAGYGFDAQALGTSKRHARRTNSQPRRRDIKVARTPSLEDGRGTTISTNDPLAILGNRRKILLKVSQ